MYDYKELATDLSPVEYLQAHPVIFKHKILTLTEYKEKALNVFKRKFYSSHFQEMMEEIAEQDKANWDNREDNLWICIIYTGADSDDFLDGWFGWGYSYPYKPSFDDMVYDLFSNLDYYQVLNKEIDEFHQLLQYWKDEHQEDLNKIDLEFSHTLFNWYRTFPWYFTLHFCNGKIKREAKFNVAMMSFQGHTSSMSTYWGEKFIENYYSHTQY